MADSTKYPSIFDLEPSEQGGPVARSGFRYQDHVAVHFLLDLASNEEIKEVWCETHDDILLIVDAKGSRRVNYIQVKATELSHLWSVAELCKGNDKSLYVKSLLRDCANEESSFTIATMRDVNSDLKILTYPLDSEGRKQGEDEVGNLLKEIDKRIPNTKSAKGNGTEYWISNTLWMQMGSEQAISNSNKSRLNEYLFSIEGIGLFPEQIERLYLELLALVKDAGDKPWKPHPEEKKFKKLEIKKILSDKSEDIRNASSGTTSQNLKKKMARASLTKEQIRTAVELRIQYSRANRMPKYMDVDDHKELPTLVLGKLQEMTSKLYAGEITNDGQIFHRECLKRIDNLDDRLQGNSSWRKPYMHGCMYDITDRCGHQFKKIEK